MPASVNIPQSCDDPFYRYKRPLLVVEQLRRGGGTTVLKNAAAVAKAIYRSDSDLRALYQQCYKCTVQLKNGEVIIHKLVDAADCEEQLERYIEREVLCPRCRNPETVSSEGSARQCQACGHVL